MREARLEDYIVKKLIDFDDIDYFTQSDLLYDLAGQAVAHYKAQRYDSQEVVAKASAAGKWCKHAARSCRHGRRQAVGLPAAAP